MKETTKSKIVVFTAIGLVVILIQLTGSQRAARCILVGLGIYFTGVITAWGMWTGLKWIIRSRRAKRYRKQEDQTRQADAEEYRKNIKAYNDDISNN